MAEGSDREAQAVDQAKARILALQRRQQQLAAEGISRYVQLLGMDQRFVIVMLTANGPIALWHGLEQAQATEVLRTAYSDMTGLLVPEGSA